MFLGADFLRPFCMQETVEKQENLLGNRLEKLYNYSIN